ncbi:rhodanese-like domain-containing protein [Marinobacterium rhizophilum]|uniref:Rhodanese-like domain-containing protein n=1 Tax=Marinobacterium rhizophilum TaxID=420402 RepID=A0ABY5HKV7_9GAMM|nr:rhodanese-like domain-containing protein [Marinobacterium rhizophilum]UTW12506.1 rhodanese-like domain-containing protein [Marinobacterium rhizophilum]
MNASITTLSAADFALRQRTEDCTVLDVRSGNEYRQHHLPGSLHMALHELEQQADRIAQLAPTEPIYLLCQSGARARTAAAQLCRTHHNPLVIIEGGLNALRAGETPAAATQISLERQVRILAGALVLLGVLLGTLVTPLGYGLSAFVGAGLIFAGATNRCTLALLLARMPWNR